MQRCIAAHQCGRRRREDRTSLLALALALDEGRFKRCYQKPEQGSLAPSRAGNLRSVPLDQITNTVIIIIIIIIMKSFGNVLSCLRPLRTKRDAALAALAPLLADMNSAAFSFALRGFH